MFKKNNHNFSLIKNNKELDQFIAKIKNKKKFYFDTEFERRSTYKAIISIVVIFDGKNIGVIDCLEKKINFKKIFKFLNKKKNTLIIHSSRQDLEIFLSIVKKILFNIFDTQIAALFNKFVENNDQILVRAGETALLANDNKRILRRLKNHFKRRPARKLNF